MNDVGQKISVCLLTYNHVDLIKSTLKSILQQTISAYEVIVSDDCSTDGTWDQILKISQEDCRIRPIQTPRNLGMPGNANFAVEKSTRPYIALLHHDDIYRENLLEKWAELMETSLDIGFVFNSYAVYGSNKIYSESIPGGRVDGPWLLDRFLFPHWGCVIRGTAMIRRTAWEDIGGMREKYRLLADIDCWMRLCMRWSAGYVPEPLITVRHQRPSYYPDIYKGERWSWIRQRCLYEIHAINRLEHLRRRDLSARFRWFYFRLRLSLETAKWITYALVKRKFDMIATCEESATTYDQMWLRMFRGIVYHGVKHFG